MTLLPLKLFKLENVLFSQCLKVKAKLFFYINLSQLPLNPVIYWEFCLSSKKPWARSRHRHGVPCPVGGEGLGWRAEHTTTHQILQTWTNSYEFSQTAEPPQSGWKKPFHFTVAEMFHWGCQVLPRRRKWSFFKWTILSTSKCMAATPHLHLYLLKALPGPWQHFLHTSSPSICISPVSHSQVPVKRICFSSEAIFQQCPL